jgi:mRNA-degrading endonuclease YafQ of YafQ-DinJ toxin-antitoxin module
MAFKSITTGYFDKKFSKLTGKNRTFKLQVINKMKCIRQNPEIGEPKSHNLRGLRALHISEHFVVVYLIFENAVVFVNLDHHDKAYNSEVTRRLVKRLMDDEGLLAALEISNIQIEDFINLVRSVGKQK